MHINKLAYVKQLTWMRTHDASRWRAYAHAMMANPYANVNVLNDGRRRTIKRIAEGKEENGVG